MAKQTGRKDRKIEVAFDNFTSSIEALVQTLKEDAENQKTLFEQIGESMSNNDISSTIASIKADTSELVKGQKEIIKTIKDLKKEKEKGIFEKLNDNKKSVVEGAKTILLIAGSVLAIGLAFKMVSGVDFASVIALGITLPLIAFAFAKVMEIKDFSINKVAQVGAAFVIMGLSIAATSWILAEVETISIGQMTTSIIIGTGLAAIANIYSKIDKKELSNVFFTSLAMVFVGPLMAASITFSSWILSEVIPLSIPAAISSIIIAGTLGLMAWAYSKIDAKSIGKLVLVAGVMVAAAPLMALGVVLASHVLTKMNYVPTDVLISAIKTAIAIGVMAIPIYILGKLNVKQVIAGTVAAGFIAVAMPYVSEWLAKGTYTKAPDLMWSLGVGVSLMAFAIPVYFLSKSDPDKTATGLLSVLIIAAAIPVISHFLAKGVYKDYPTLSWSLGVGVSLMAFAIPVYFLSKVDEKTIIQGLLSVAAIAMAIPVISMWLGQGKYDKYPTLEWSLGAGVSILAFGLSAIILGKLIEKVGPAAAILGGIAVLGIAAVIVGASHILGMGEYSAGKYPSLDWAEGVGLSLLGFSTAVLVLGAVAATGVGALVIGAGILSVIAIAKGLVEVSKIIQEGVYTGGPSKEWAEGVGLSLSYFAQAISALTPSFLGMLFGESIDKNISSMVKLGGALKQIGEAVGNDSSVYTGGPKKEWAEGVGLSIKYFASALEDIKPGFFASLLGADLDGQIEGMVALAKGLSKIGDAVAQGKSTYTGGPKKEWAEGVGGSVAAFANAIAQLADKGVDPEDISEWMTSLDPIAHGMVRYANMFAAVKFDSYPKMDWVTGIKQFIQEFSTLDVIDDAAKSAEKVTKLADSFLKLAGSISKVGEAVKDLKDSNIIIAIAPDTATSAVSIKADPGTVVSEKPTGTQAVKVTNPVQTQPVVVNQTTNNTATSKTATTSGGGGGIKQVNVAQTDNTALLKMQNELMSALLNEFKEMKEIMMGNNTKPIKA